MIYKNNNTNNILIVTFTLLQILLVIGHFYRYDFDHQFKNWQDGDIYYGMFGGESYVLNRDKNDSFDIWLYENIKSINDAADYIKKTINVNNQKEIFFATFDLARKRFIHYMYPHYTLLQNPFLTIADMLMPSKPYNAMEVADEKLRYSAGGGCGDASNVFIEIYQLLGGKARIVGLGGHIVVEAMVDDRVWFVDANLETYSQNSIKDMSLNPKLIDKAYSFLDDKLLQYYKDMFFTKNTYFGFNSVPSVSPRIYKFHSFLSWFKWFIYPIILLFLLIIINRKQCAD